MARYEKMKTRRRDDYYFLLDYRTRWSDNDQYVWQRKAILMMLTPPLLGIRGGGG